MPKLGIFHIVDMPETFTSRTEAAEMLAFRLHEYKGRNPLILAIRRGAVPMRQVIAELLDGELDVVLVHKLDAPFNAEIAIGAIDETGWAYIAPYAEEYGGTGDFLEEEKARQLQVLRKRRTQYTPSKQPIDPNGHIVIVVDDGLATGATMIAALHATRAKQPAELVCAIPVAAPDSLEQVAPPIKLCVSMCPLTLWQSGNSIGISRKSTMLRSSVSCPRMAKAKDPASIREVKMDPPLLPIPFTIRLCPS